MLISLDVHDSYVSVLSTIYYAYLCPFFLAREEDEDLSTRIGITLLD